LFAFDRCLYLQLRGGVMLSLVDMKAATAAAGLKPAVGVERVVEGGHRLLLPACCRRLQKVQSLCHAARR
jgi:hypothetical protein